MHPLGTCFLDKSGDPFADALAVHGLAALLREVLTRAYDDRRTSPSVRIQDQGAYYRLDCNPVIDDGAIAGATSMSLFRAIRTAKNAGSLADLPHGMCLDYEDVRDRRAVYFEWLQALPREQRAAVVRGELRPEEAPDPPHPHWDTLRAVNPAALAGHNALALNWWKAQEALPQVLRILLDMLSTVPNDVERALQQWEALDRENGWGIQSKRNTLQLFNPAQGKGQNRAKANALSMDNVDGFWLLEWLKVVGFYQVGVTRRVAGGDRKSYALAPRTIEGGHLGEIMSRFKRDMLGSETAIRLDILAAVRFTKALLKYAQENQATELSQQIILRSARPRDIVGGFHAAFYKNLGRSSATMNLSFIALPGWVWVRDADDVRSVIELLDEHEQIVRQFDESHSNEVSLLQTYRDFLSGDDLDAFFAFTTQYAGFVMGRRESGLPARQLTTEGMERLLMNMQTNFYEIVKNEGFQQVAYAIRQSTVTAQYRKQQGDRRYDVRYGLHHELARTAHQPERLVAALGDFMAKYNAENAQVMETRPGPYRTSLTTSDIEQVMWLVDQYASEVVCNLLIAYGYARVPHEEGRHEQSA